MTWKERNKTVITLVNLFKNLCEAQRWVKRTKMCLVAVGAVSLLKNQLYFYIPETNNNKSLKLYFTIAKIKKKKLHRSWEKIKMTEIKHYIICLDRVIFPNWFLCLMQFHSKFEHFLVLCGNWETNSKMYMVMKSTHNSKAILRSKKKEYLFYQLFSESEKKVKVTQSCLTLCDPMDYTVHGILQARIGCIAFPFSRGCSQPRDWIQVPHMAGGFFSSWATRETQE